MTRTNEATKAGERTQYRAINPSKDTPQQGDEFKLRNFHAWNLLWFGGTETVRFLAGYDYRRPVVGN